MFDVNHADFAGYLGALRAHRRHDILRSVRKAQRAGVRLDRLRDPDDIDRVYTDEVHRLYTAVVHNSEHQLELLPPRFFRDLARAFPGRVELVTATLDGRIVAFNWSIVDGDAVHLLFCGIDYAANPTADLYFNIMYAELDRAMRPGVKLVHMGQTADTFKGRLGCRQDGRFVYVKGRSAVTSRILAAAAGVLFPAPGRPPRYNLFRA
jgi:predicted N-acyltransferase